MTNQMTIGIRYKVFKRLYPFLNQLFSQLGDGNGRSLCSQVSISSDG
ncbi:hypothetical protein [Phormidesmis sp. 146-33]